MKNWTRWTTGLIFLVAFATNSFGAGSGLNVVVVVNQNSTNSLQLGNYYCEKRGVPSQNVLRINWSGGNIDWSKADFETYLRAPLNSMLSSRPLSNQIDYVLLSMDIPYRVVQSGLPPTSGTDSTTSALFYGFKPDVCVICPAGIPSCSLPPGSTNAYAGSEDIFRHKPPIAATSNSWLVMMLTSSNLAQAMAVVDRGVASDGVVPTQTVYLGKSPDVNRNVRYLLFDNAIFDSRLRGNYSLRPTNIFSPYYLVPLLGFENGLQSIFLDTNTFVPGAMADDLTSASGFILEDSDHTDALDFLNAGATASYGTVIEPCAYLQKFPSSQNYFYQARGFSIAECYYMSVTNPYQGIMLGEPLAAPFAMPCSGAWSSLPANVILSGSTNLSLGFVAADATRPVQRVDLFLDGVFSQTLTNVAPGQDNQLYVTLNGQMTNYAVPAGATIKSVASNLTATLNSSAYSNATKVAAFVHGDRIELQGLDITVPGSQISLSVSNAVGGASVLTSFLHASLSNFLDTIAYGRRNFVITNAPLNGSFLQLAVTTTNGVITTLSVTNPPGNTNTSVLVEALVDSINTNATLITGDGLVAEDFISYESQFNGRGGEFNLRARAPGWAEAQIQAHLSSSANFDVIPSGTVRLDENLRDLRPRNHLYVTAGLTNLPLTFSFNTSTQADGYHELTAVAYEGGHVRTQSRVSQNVRIQNTTLSAALTPLVGDTNTALEATLQFLVVANTNTISRIELFSTGGSWGVVFNQSSATFSLAATNLGIGLHPFYALVTRADNKQFRTDTKWIRIIGAEPPFSVTVLDSTPTLAWPATAGRRYEILSTTNVTATYTLRNAVTPTNSPGLWEETNNSAPQRFYRVRSSQ